MRDIDITALEAALAAQADRAQVRMLDCANEASRRHHHGLAVGLGNDRAAAEYSRSSAIAHEVKVVSAHRTPDLLFEYASTGRSRAGSTAIIAGAGGAAHLPGMTAAKTRMPVLGVPVQSKSLNGLDSLLSIVQMPAGVPVATFASRHCRRRQCRAVRRRHPRARQSRGRRRNSWHSGRHRPTPCSRSRDPRGTA